MAALIVWVEGEDVPKLYVIPGEAAEPYKAVDGAILNLHDTHAEQDMLIEHLAYMLGTEPYYNPTVPTLEAFKAEAAKRYLEATVKGADDKPAFAPWHKYVVVSPVQLNDVRTIIRTGWL